MEIKAEDTRTDLQKEIDLHRRTYLDALHAVQSAVAILVDRGHSQVHPKHLRVGVNSALINSSALGKLLIDKGIITEVEYVKSLAVMAQAEVRSYEDLLSKMYGIKVSLA